MNHLSDEQLEMIMLAGSDDSGHLQQCPQCSDRLQEKASLAKRLRSAYASLSAGEGLKARISRQLSQAGTGPEVAAVHHFRKWLKPVLAAAAVIIAAPLLIYLISSPSVSIAQEELVKIHQHNISGMHGFYSDSDPEKLASYMRRKLGFDITMPRQDQGLSLRGCCVRHFRGSIVGSYVVETDAGVMSIVVVTDEPKTLGTGKKYEYQGQQFWKGSFAKCSMVTVRIGDYSYCAVGEISHDYLASLLTKLIPEEN